MDDDRKTRIEHEDFTPRGTITRVRNGKALSGFTSVTLKDAHAILAFVVTLLSLGGALMAISEWVIAPRLKAQMEETASAVVAPVQRELLAHESASSSSHAEFVKKQDITKDREELRETLRDIKAQVEYLYRNEIEKGRKR